METLGIRRRHQLLRLASGLEERETPEFFVVCLAAQGVEARIQSDKQRIDNVMAAAWAFDRATRYLERLRILNAERQSLNEAITARLAGNRPQIWGDSTLPRSDAQAGRMAGDFEVVANLYCVCVIHIGSLLKSASESLDVEFPEQDLAFLNELRPLRNQFEHWYNRLPGKTHQRELVTRTETHDTYTVRAGLQLDRLGRYIVTEYKKVDGKEEEITHYVDLRNHNCERVERIFADTDARLRKASIDQLITFVAEHPNMPIPAAKSIRTDGLFRAGGID